MYVSWTADGGFVCRRLTWSGDGGLSLSADGSLYPDIGLEGEGIDAFLSNSSTDLYPSLIFGSLYFIPRNSNIDCSVGKCTSTASPFFPPSILDNPCSFNV